MSDSLGLHLLAGFLTVQHDFITGANPLSENLLRSHQSGIGHQVAVFDVSD